MKRFTFRLQIVLDQRQTKEDAILLELRDVQNEHAQECAHLQALEDRLMDARNNLQKALSEKAPLAEVIQLDTWAKATTDDIGVQKLTIQAVNERLEDKRTELIAAMRDRQALESLRDRQQQAYLLEQERQQQNELDEMACVRYARGL